MSETKKYRTSLGDVVLISNEKTVSIYIENNGTKRPMGAHLRPEPYEEALARNFDTNAEIEIIVNLRTDEVFEGAGLPVQILTSSNAEKLGYAAEHYKRVPLVN